MSFTDRHNQAFYDREIEEGPKAGMRVQVWNFAYNHRMILSYPNEMDGWEIGFCFPKNGDAVKAAGVWDGIQDPAYPWIKQAGTERIGPAYPRHRNDPVPPPAMPPSNPVRPVAAKARARAQPARMRSEYRKKGTL